MAKKRDTKKDPMHIDFYIEMFRKNGDFERVEEFKDVKNTNKQLKKIRAGNIITFEELVNLPEGYEYISNCSGNIDVEIMTDLKVEGIKISWSQSSGDSEIEIGVGEVKNIPHCSDGDYEFTLYHINPKKKK